MLPRNLVIKDPLTHRFEPRSLSRRAGFAAALLCGLGPWLPASASAQGCDQFEQIASPVVGSEMNVLLGVAALSATDVWAVGYYRIGSSQLPLSMHWNGTDWTVVPMPVPMSLSGVPSVTLTDVRAFAPDDVWAVGSNQGPIGVAIETLAYRWNGSQWLVVPSPTALPTSYGSNFYCIDGVSGDDFWAVGYANTPAPNARALAAHWNGSGWEEHLLQSSGNPKVSALKDVHVLGADDIWALEGIGIGVPNSPRRILHWNGSTWDQGAPQLDPLRYRAAEAIFAFSPQDIWVSSVVESTFQTVMLHWDGTAWTEMIVPAFAYEFFGSSPDNLFAVAATSILHWDGSTWSVRATLPGLPGGNCFDAELGADGVLWCAGSTQPGPVAQTLTARAAPCGPWNDLAHGLAGAQGVPQLWGSGTLQAGMPVTLALSNALPSSPSWLVIGSGPAFAPFLGGVLVPTPTLVVGGLLTDASGKWIFPGTLQPGTPSGVGLWFQAWILDPAGPASLAASNGVLAFTQ